MAEGLVDVFNSMDWPRQPFEFNLYKEWKKKINNAGKTTEESSDVLLETVSSEVNISRLLSRLGDLLKDEEALLVEILCSAAFSRADSRNIIDLMKRQLDYFASSPTTSNDTRFNCSRDTRVLLKSEVWDWDLPVFGQMLASSLASSCCRLIIETTEDDVFLDFYRAIIDLVIKAGYPERLIGLNTSGSKTTNKGKDYFCPMIVCEDSDLDSAVECIVHAAWDFYGKLSWSLTHVFIEESVFRLVADKLKLRLKSLEHGSRFCRGTDLCEIPDFVDKRNFAQLEVYPEERNCCHRLFVGWDPWLCEEREVRARYRGCGISLMGFRTEAEALELVNSRRPTAVSLWSNSLSRVGSLPSLIKDSGTVWINCHGLIDPSVTFGTVDNGGFYAGGKQLLQEVLRTCSGESNSDQDPIQRSSRGDDDALKVLESARKSWSTIDTRRRCHIIAHQINTSVIPALTCSRSKEENWKVEEDALLKVAEVSTSSSTSATRVARMIGCRHAVFETKTQAPIVVIHVSSFYARLEEDIVLAIGHVLAAGSSVIVLYTQEAQKSVDMKRLYRSFFTGGSLPSDLILFVSEGVERSCSVPLGNIPVLHLSSFSPISDSSLPLILFQRLTITKRVTWIPGFLI